MVMKVEVYELTDGDQVKAGTITWDGAKYVLNPEDSDVLQVVLNDPIDKEGGGIIGRSRPKEFMEGLPRFYSGSYLRVAKVEDDVQTKSGSKDDVIPLYRNKPAIME